MEPIQVNRSDFGQLVDITMADGSKIKAEALRMVLKSMFLSLASKLDEYELMEHRVEDIENTLSEYALVLGNIESNLFGIMDDLKPIVGIDRTVESLGAAVGAIWMAKLIGDYDYHVSFVSGLAAIDIDFIKTDTASYELVSTGLFSPNTQVIFTPGQMCFYSIDYYDANTIKITLANAGQMAVDGLIDGATIKVVNHPFSVVEDFEP
jgi:hypothetical protein